MNKHIIQHISAFLKLSRYGAVHKDLWAAFTPQSFYYINQFKKHS